MKGFIWYHKWVIHVLSRCGKFLSSLDYLPLPEAHAVNIRSHEVLNGYLELALDPEKRRN
jgi:hypothetical protein